MLAFVSLLLGVWAWWSTNTKRNDTHLIATCRSLYADARSRADTLRIDLIDPVEPNDAGSEKLTCGALRTSGQLG